MDSRAYQDINLAYDEDAGVGTVTLSRPDRLNALTDSLLEEFADALGVLQELNRDGDTFPVRIVVVEGDGSKAFSSGVDTGEYFEGHEFPNLNYEWQSATEAIATTRAPIVAKIDGYCLGGALELALACDFRVASHRSEFGFPEVTFGAFPAGGGTQRLPRLVGVSRAKELVMTGQRLGGGQAAEEGIVDHVYEYDALDAEVREFADSIADKPAPVIHQIKDAIDKSQDLGLQDGLAYERQAYHPLTMQETFADQTRPSGE